MIKHFLKEPTDKNLHLHFELITKPNNPIGKFNLDDEDAIAEEHLNDPKIENADKR